MLKIVQGYQWSFTPTHAGMSALNLHYALPKHELACNLRKMFSGIVSGNFKEEGVLSFEKNVLFQISGGQKFMRELDSLLSIFCSQRRMKFSREIEKKYATR